MNEKKNYENINHSSIIFDTIIKTNLLMAKSLYKNIVLTILGKMQRGRLTLKNPDADDLTFGETDEIIADIKVNDDQFYKQIVLYGDIGFGESYMNKLWETNDLTKLVSFFIANMAHLPHMSGAKKLFSPINILKLSNRIQLLLKPNSLKGSKKNISDHYDLNNDFFKLFLDPSMTYSSAYFESTKQSLEQGQINKYERLCREVKLKESDHVLEIGCGWGGFAEYAASKFNCKVTGITISREQYNYAIEHVKKAGLSNNIEIVFKDYRKVQGRFDKIISIEMIEAVGHKYFKTYFDKINQLLKPGGILGIQAIVVPDSRYDEYRKSVDWLQKYIFPGGLLPSIAKINESVNISGNLNLYGFKEMGLSYARTLRHWIENFNSNLNLVKSLGFDDIFIRKWEYYLCCCEASFLQRNINVVQMIYARPNDL